MQTGGTTIGRARSAQARRQEKPRATQTTTEMVGDPLAIWADLLLRLRALLHDLGLSGEQLDQIAWHVKSRRFAAGDVIALGGNQAGIWALVVRGAVAARPLPKSPRDRLPPRQPATLIQPGSSLGEAMLLHGEPSPCTYQAASDAELFVLHRSDFLAVVAPDGQPTAAKVTQGRKPWLWPTLVFALLVATGIWIALGNLPKSRGVSSEPKAPVLLGGGETTIRLIHPSDGSVVVTEEAIQIEAGVSGSGVSQVVLLVDGEVLGKQAIVGGEGEGWALHLVWTGSVPGSHVISILAEGADGSTLASDLATVTIVPAGRLIFSSNRGSVDAIYEMATDGTRVRLLTEGPGGCRQPAVRQDGALAFVVDEGGLESRLRWIPARADGAVDLFPGREPAWSANGDRLAFSRSVNGVSQVFVGRSVDWTLWQLTTEAVYAGQPTWSPDGTRLAYVAEHDGNLDIWIVTTKGNEAIQVTDNPATDWAPAWSPDGSHLAFVSDRSGKTQVYVATIGARSAARQVTNMVLGAESPAWSPDGYWLVVVGYSGDGAGVDSREIYLVRADGTEQVRLTENSHDDAHPVWVGQ